MSICAAGSFGPQRTRTGIEGAWLCRSFSSPACSSRSHASAQPDQVAVPNQSGPPGPHWATGHGKVVRVRKLVEGKRLIRTDAVAHCVL